MARGMTLAAWAAAALMWQAMMLVMMAPAAYPWLRAARLTAPAGTRYPATGFGAGYAAAWLPFSALLAALQLDLAHALPAAPREQALCLFAAGVYQFTPLKQACLRHCRHPLSFLLARWENGAASTFRLGVRHGWFCLGCCWALMALALVLGAMNLLWMAALAAVVFVEQALPRAAWVRTGLGLALVAAAAARALV